MYRADTGYDRSKHTALDIVRYETEELGNDLSLIDNVSQLLSGVNGRQLVWLTMYSKDARHYGKPEFFDVPQGSLIIGEDGDGGYLILLARLVKENTLWIGKLGTR